MCSQISYSGKLLSLFISFVISDDDDDLGCGAIIQRSTLVDLCREAAKLKAMGVMNQVGVLHWWVPGRCGCYLKLAIFKLLSRIDILGISCDMALRWMPQDLADDKSTLVLVMAWCCHPTNHCLNQCWLSSISLSLTHWGRVMHICVVEMGHHWFR